MPFRLILLCCLAMTSQVSAQKYPYTFQGDFVAFVAERVVPVVGAHVFNGVRIEKYGLETGITVGVDGYPQFLLIPAMAGVKWMPFPKAALVPYLNVNAGRSLAWLNRHTDEKDFKGGGVFNPSLGIRFRSKTKERLNLGVGYLTQNAQIVETRYDDLGRVIDLSTEQYRIRRMSLNFGISF